MISLESINNNLHVNLLLKANESHQFFVALYCNRAFDYILHYLLILHYVLIYMYQLFYRSWGCNIFCQKFCTVITTSSALSVILVKWNLEIFFQFLILFINSYWFIFWKCFTLLKKFPVIYVSIQEAITVLNKFITYLLDF